ncbi:MAG: hypothetical protein IPF99_00680 [Deltaproteobacteria bacterium]|nr:hypothetical protein [Deltaproteobacteria bacterium]
MSPSKGDHSLKAMSAGDCRRVMRSTERRRCISPTSCRPRGMSRVSTKSSSGRAPCQRKAPDSPLMAGELAAKRTPFHWGSVLRAATCWVTRDHMAGSSLRSAK